MPKKLRPQVFIWPSWITKLVAGECQCEWAAWFKAHHYYDKKPSDFNLASWTIQHNELLHQRRDGLERLGYEVYLEDQNSFKVDISAKREGKPDLVFTISGKADIIAIGEMEDLSGKMNPSYLVEDCKTGSPKTSDHVQVVMYMIFIPMAMDKFKDTKFSGCIVYKLGIPNMDITPEQAQDESLKRIIWDVIKKIAGDESGCRKYPSYNECKRCDITKADCPERKG
jgi:hypothetical protein